ncbi:MAG: hypothetical protein V4645_30030 [Pseudomonadota bacterium]
MGSISIWHWGIAIVMAAPILALAIVPGWRILQRAGFSGAWSLLVFVPFLGFLVPWVLAFVKWPNDAQGRTRTSVAGIILGVVMLPVAFAVIAVFARVGAGPTGIGASAPTAAPAQQTPAPPPPAAADEWWKKGSKPVN